MEINITINGGSGSSQTFLHNSEYTTYYLEELKAYENSFQGIHVLNVDLQEDFQPTAAVTPRQEGRLVGRYRYDIAIKFRTYPDKNGGVIYPNRNNIFSTIKWTMKDEVNHYKELYERKNPVLVERLKELDVDMTSNHSVLGNELHGSLGSAGYSLNLNQRIWSLSPEDLYQLGTLIIVDRAGVIFTKEEIIEQMKEKLEVQG